MQVRTKAISIIVLGIIFFGAAGAAGARGLTVIVDASSVMEELWQGSTRGQELLKAFKLLLGA
jgi:hypothetical protein